MVLDLSLLGSLQDGEARSQIREITNRLLLEESAPLSLVQRQFITRRIEDEVMGHGPLEPLLADPTVSDILVTGPSQVYVERRGKLEMTDYGTPVTPERLARVERAEAALRALGLRSFRVRHHGDVGRIELSEEEMADGFARREALAAAVRAAGFPCAVLDLEPFRSGWMNELAGLSIPVERA